MAGDGNWNKLLPIAGEKARLISGQLRDNNSGIETAIAAEHVFSGTTAATQTGAHKQGSARCFFQSAAPATTVDGSAFASTDLGAIWIDSDDNKIYILTATTPTWTNISVEQFATFLAAARVFGSTLGVTGNFTVGANKFIVAASSGNTAITGALSVAGEMNPSLFSTGNGGFIDEDTMATNSATKVPSQQSVKAYVDTSIDNLKLVAASKNKDTNYTASKDGFLVVMCTITWDYGVDTFITVKSDSSATPTTIVGKVGAKATRADSESNIVYHTLIVPIVSGLKYRVEDTGAGAVIDSIIFY